jgi:F0F1-type ATP synthase membrane subunit b/b'
METALISLLTGPTGALALSVGILVWLGKTAVPILKTYLEKQNDLIAELVKSHQRDRDSFVASLDKISDRLDKMSEATNAIHSTVQALSSSVESITAKLKDERKE